MAKLSKHNHAHNRARREGKPSSIERFGDRGEGREINENDLILDRVRPEVREEALQIQQRLQLLIAGGDVHVGNSGGASVTNGEEYNINAAFPFDVRVNNKVVEVLAPVEHKINGKNRQSARKSAARWQPLPPRQVAQLNQLNTPSVRKAHQEHQRHLTHPTPVPQRRPKPGPAIPTPGLRSDNDEPNVRQRPNKLKQTAKHLPKLAPGSREGHARTDSTRRSGAWVRTDNGKLFLPGLEVDDDGEESDTPFARPRRRRGPRHLIFGNGDNDDGDDENEDDENEDDSDDEIYSPAMHRKRNRKAKEPAKSVAELVAEFEATRGGIKRKNLPVLFPASQPPPKLFVPAKRLRKGYQAVAEEKEKIHPTFDLDKTHPIDRHLRIINKTTGLWKTEKEKPLVQRVKQPSTIPEPLNSPDAKPQVPDVVQGEEAYRGRVFRTVERDRELGREEGLSSLFGDDDGIQSDDSDVVMVLDRPPTPETKKDWREEFLPKYLEEADRDPFAAFR